MWTQDHTDRLSYLSALALTFSLVEASLPHALPFLRIGLANIPLLWALGSFNLSGYFALAALKWLLSSFISGLLFSPFALVSLAGTASSALVMLVLHRAFSRFISLYTVSALGAVVSGFFQLAVSASFLSEAVMNLVPLMMLFNLVCGVVTAFIAYRFPAADNVKVQHGDSTAPHPATGRFMLFFILAFIFIILSQSIIALAATFILAIIFSRLNGRKTKWMIYIITFIAVVFFNLLTPSGRVLFLFVTQDALTAGLERALRLLSLAALSQSLATLPLTGSSLVSETLQIASQLEESFYSSQAPVLERLRNTLCEDSFQTSSKDVKSHSLFMCAVFCTAIVLVSVVCLLFKLP